MSLVRSSSFYLCSPPPCSKRQLLSQALWRQKMGPTAAADANLKRVSPAAQGPSPSSVTQCPQDSGAAVQPGVVSRASARASVFLLLEERRAAPGRHVQLLLDISASVWGQTTRNSPPPSSASPPPGGSRSPALCVCLRFLPFCGFPWSPSRGPPGDDLSHGLVFSIHSF